MTYRTTSRALAVAAIVPVLALAACSSDDSSDEATTAPNDTAAPDDTAMTDDTAMDDTGACPEETDITITGSELEPGDDLDWVWAVSDDGPDVLNGDDQNMELGFATFELPEDEQFGIQIPVGVPDVPEGETFFNISLFSPDGTLEAGQTFIDQIAYDQDPTAYDGEINFFSFYVGSERDVLFNDFEVELTEISLEHVCGTITSLGDSSLQDQADIEGEFIVDRIEYLDGDIPEDAMTDDTSDE